MTSSGGTLTSEQILEELCRTRGWRYNLLVGSLLLPWLVAPLTSYITSFTGFDPSTTAQWECATKQCRAAIALDPTLLSMYPCDIRNITYRDIVWVGLDRTSFSADYGLYCPDQAARKTLISSMYFAGALAGLLTGSFVYDYIGRKRSHHIGVLVQAGALVGGVFCSSYTLLLLVRFCSGLAGYWLGTACYIHAMELVTGRLRNIVNMAAMLGWCAGYPLAVGVAYYVRDWHLVFLGALVATVVCNVQVFFLAIESPKFFILKNNEQAARKSFKALASLTFSELDLDNIKIEEMAKVQDRVANPLTQVKELCCNPTFLLETLLVCYLWFFSGMSYYGFNFGWDSILEDPYLGYLMAMVGEVLAYVLSTILIAYSGRRRSMFVMLLLLAVSYMTAMIRTDSRWSVESVSCLFGLMFVSGVFSLAYLWAAELAPTSHRGSVVCICNAAARLGAFIGPFIFNYFGAGERWAVLGVLAGLAVLGTAASAILPETANKEPPTTPADVRDRRQHHRYGC